MKRTLHNKEQTFAVSWYVLRGDLFEPAGLAILLEGASIGGVDSGLKPVTVARKPGLPGSKALSRDGHFVLL